MSKKIITVFLTAAAALSMSVTSFAASWQSSDTGWWYENDGGSYPTNTWKWIDGNSDGTFESYYFDANGYLLTETTTPDGYDVNSDGAWIENGVIQQKTTLSKSPKQIYIDAANKTNQSDSMEADAKTTMIMTADSQSLEISSIMNMKYKDLNTSSMKYLATVKTQSSGEESDGITFYTNGSYYIDMNGQKIKMPMNMDEMTAKIKQSSAMYLEDYIYMKNIHMTIDESGNKVISYSIDSEALIDTVKSIYAGLGMDMTVFEMSIRDVSCVSSITPDGYCKGESVKMIIDMKVEENIISTTTSIDIQYKNPGQAVDFTLPSTNGFSELS